MAVAAAAAPAGLPLLRSPPLLALLLRTAASASTSSSDEDTKSITLSAMVAVTVAASATKRGEHSGSTRVVSSKRQTQRLLLVLGTCGVGRQTWFATVAVVGLHASPLTKPSAHIATTSRCALSPAPQGRRTWLNGTIETFTPATVAGAGTCRDAPTSHSENGAEDRADTARVSKTVPCQGSLQHVWLPAPVGALSRLTATALSRTQIARPGPQLCQQQTFVLSCCVAGGWFVIWAAVGSPTHHL